MRIQHHGLIAILCARIAFSQQPLQPAYPTGQAIRAGQHTPTLRTSTTKLSGALREKAKAGGSLKLVLVLSKQIENERIMEIRSATSGIIRAFDEQTRQVKPGDQFANEKRRGAAAQRDKLIVSQRKAIANEAKAIYASQQDLISARIAGMGGQVIEKFVVANMIFVEVPSSAVEALASDSEIVGIFEDETKQLDLGLTTKVLGAPVLWDAGYRGGTQTVAIIDSGIFSSHIGFAGVNIDSYQQLDTAMKSGCVATLNAVGEDADSHGTHVAGIIASQGTSVAPDLVGVAPGVGRLVSIQVGVKGKGTKDCPELLILTTDVLRALQFAVFESAAHVINLSLGSNTSVDDKLENWVIDKLIDDYDVTIVVAAGNSGLSSSRYQLDDLALSPNALAVANLDPRRTLTKTDDRIAESSSNGPSPLGRHKPDIAAPGTNVTSLVPNNEYATMSGTSMAAPHIAGAAALLYDAGVSGHKEVKALLLNSASGTVGWSRSAGWGAADLEAAYAQRGAIESSTIRGGTARYYRVPVGGSMHATLVWNRHIKSITPDGLNSFGDFRDLNLEAFDENLNRGVDSSTGKIDNVEQIALTGQGSAIVKVSHIASDNAAESFALAFSTAAYKEVSPGKLSVRCAAPKEVSATMKIFVQCTAQNTGDLPLYGSTIRLSAPQGFTSLAISPVAKVTAGGQISFQVDISTPSNVLGPVDYSVLIESVSFGDRSLVTIPLSINIRKPKPQDCTMVVTPASGTLVLSYLAQTFTLKIQFPRFDPNEPGFCSYDAWETGAWFSLSGRKSGQGDGEFLVIVTQSGKNSIYSTRLGTFRLNMGVNFTFQQNYMK